MHQKLWQVKEGFFRFLKGLLLFLGGIFLLFVILSFTDIPFRIYYWLGTSKAHIEHEPDYLVVMGAGGMPGPEGLMRCYYAAAIAHAYPESELIIALPAEKNRFYQSDTYAMAREITLRGVDSTRILFAAKGMNTRTQALEIAEMLPEKDSSHLLIITSPVHMLRAVKSFNKVGFADVGGLPSFGKALAEKELKVKEGYPGLDNLDLRYNMWNYMKYQIDIARELLALVYYKFRGWI
jgi:uncharacterized SAM-binding protein YcdF (DUF218 family)